MGTTAHEMQQRIIGERDWWSEPISPRGQELQEVYEATENLFTSCREAFELTRKWEGALPEEAKRLGGEHFASDQQRLGAALARCERLKRELDIHRMNAGLT